MLPSLRAASCARVASSLFIRPTISTFARSFSTTQPTFDSFVPPKQRVPPPTQTVPDVSTFLTAIGRKTVEHADTFETWESLMTMPSYVMRDKGVDTRSRRYILAWREKFAKGEQLCEIKRGKKSWGGERRRKAKRAEYLSKNPNSRK